MPAAHSSYSMAPSKDHWKICSDEQARKKYMTLAFALHLTRPNVKQIQRASLRNRDSGVIAWITLQL